MTVEDDLRTALGRRAGQVTPSEESWRRIAGRLDEDHPPRRRALAFSIAAIAAAVAVLVALWPGTPHQRVHVFGPGPSGSLSTPTPTGPPCRASQLAATAGSRGGAMSNDFTTILVANTGPAACVLSGYPTLTGIAPGRQVAFDPHHGTFFGDMVPVLVKPGTYGQMLIATGSGCSALNQPNQVAAQAQAHANTFSTVLIDLPNGGGTLEVDGVQIDVVCGVSETQLGTRQPPGSEPPPPPCTPGGLHLILDTEVDSTGVTVQPVVTSPRSPCSVDTDATMRIVDRAGIPLPGTPATAPLRGTAGVGPESSQFTNIFHWSNWCGPSGVIPHIQVAVPALDLSATVAPPATPACVAPGAGSTIDAIAYRD